ncbi:MAG: YkgJ family cysteine cluster protein [Oscillospiraceae bacterium]|nr:YkgJ family cysteine cluster protein [Oscillospiraceae bacterium]
MTEVVKPELMEQISQEYIDENLRFRHFLKRNADPKRLDEQFKRLHLQLFNGYDCCHCANCCRDFDVSFCEDDIVNAAGYIEMSCEEFVETFLTEDDEGLIIKGPCSFLEPDGRCRIQSVKPIECKSFPHTDMPERIYSLYSVMDYAQRCPIVFEIVQRLKTMYHYSDNPKDTVPGWME